MPTQLKNFGRLRQRNAPRLPPKPQPITLDLAKRRCAATAAKDRLALPYLADPAVSAADVLDVLREARPEELECCMDGLELSVRARLPDVVALHAVLPDEGSVFWWGFHADQPPSRGDGRSMVLCTARREDCVLKFVEGALHILPVRWLDLWVQASEHPI